MDGRVPDGWRLNGWIAGVWAHAKPDGMAKPGGMTKAGGMAKADDTAKAGETARAVPRPVLIADDHPLFRDALKLALERIGIDRPVREADRLQGAREIMEGDDVSLLLLDLHMEDSDGFSGLIGFRHDFPSVPVIVVSASDDPAVIRRAIHFGAAGFIPKSSTIAEIGTALSHVLDGDIWVPEGVSLDDGGSSDSDMTGRLNSLTPAQMRVLQAVAKGRLNKQIAYDMGISEATVKAHMTAVFRKLGVVNRTQAVLIARELQVDQQTVDDHG